MKKLLIPILLLSGLAHAQFGRNFIRYGSGAPTAGSCSPGQLYVDTTAHVIYSGANDGTCTSSGGGGGSPSGPAGGDLAGTYPNPTIKPSVALTTPDIGAATGTSLLLLASIGVGVSPPTACGSATGCVALNEASTAGTPTAGQQYCRADSTTHQQVCSLNGGAEYAIERKIYSGAKALATGAISSQACTSAQTDTATGALTTDVIIATFNADPTGVTGYVPLTTGGLTIYAYPTADTVNFKVCNFTSGSITPGAATINWRIPR